MSHDDRWQGEGRYRYPDEERTRSGVGQGYGQEGGWRGERDWGERAGGEVRSWFGDDDAQRRRRQDQRRSGNYGYGEAERYGYERGDHGGYGSGAGGESWGRDYGRSHRREDWRGDDRGALGRAGDEVRSWFGDHDAERRREQDAWRGEATAQHHRGRGPKGYARSDERIREEVCERLTDDPRVDASDLEVSVSGREVTLTGTVDSRDARRRAEDLAESVGGVGYVQNNLRVRQSQRGGAGSQSAAAQGVTTPPMGESITAMNSSDANRIAQDTFGPSGSGTDADTTSRSS